MTPYLCPEKFPHPHSSREHILPIFHTTATLEHE